MHFVFYYVLIFSCDQLAVWPLVLYIIILNQTLEITALQNLQNWLTVRAGINHVRNNSIGPQRSIVLKISLGEIFTFSWSWWRLKWFENKSKYWNYFEKGFFLLLLLQSLTRVKPFFKESLILLKNSQFSIRRIILLCGSLIKRVIMSASSYILIRCD